MQQESTPRRALIWSVDPTKPSFRLRMGPLAEALEARGWHVVSERFPKRPYFKRIVDRRRALAQADLVILAKLKLGLGEAAWLRRWARCLVFDFDDSVHLRKPRGLGLEPERSLIRRIRFAQTCRACDLVLAGNRFLAEVASPFAHRVEIAPTTVDCQRIRPRPFPERDSKTVVWIGLPENLLYLEPLRSVFAELSRRHEDFKLRIVSSTSPKWTDVPIEFVPWSEAGEAEALATASMGIMPLSLDDWSRGKCGFKLLQYMAAGLPSVATPVGVNEELIQGKGAGYLANRPGDWLASLDRLLSDPQLAEDMGRRGRRAVETSFDHRHEAQRVAHLLERLVASRSKAAVEA